MPKKPVIFLAFANPSLNPLSELIEENKVIYRTLLSGEEEDRYMIHQEAHTSINSLFYYLNRFSNRVFLFHFAGHADMDHILLQEEGSDTPELTFMGGVIPKLAQQKNLKCVMLNGCSTNTHAEKLLELGIPAVIGTSSPINDTKAREFATDFYQSLAAGHTILEAFDSATNHLKAKYHPNALKKSKKGKFKSISSESGLKIQHRKISLDFLNKDKEETFSWHLFFQEKSDSLQSPLPTNQIKNLKIRAIPSSLSPQPDIEKLSVDIFNEMLHYEPKLYKWLEEEVDRESHHLQAKIIMHLPSTSDNQLQTLVHLEFLDHEYLTQLIRTYDAITEIIILTCLSQLWDYKFLNKETVFPKSLKESCKRFLTLSEQGRFNFNPLPLINGISESYKQFSIPFFIEEMAFLLEELDKEEKLCETWEKMEDIRQNLKNLGEDDIKIPQIAKECESYFLVLFTRMLFIIRYKMIAVNDVMIRKSRHNSPTYEINRAVHAEASFGSRIKYKFESYANYTEDQAVILLNDTGNLDKHINLSPFVIDKNVLDYRKNPLKKYSNSALYFYNHYSAENQAYVYKSSNHQDWLEVSFQTYPKIWKMMEAFKESIFN
ncbi:MAG: CHAT domain-containing protein [Bacteroidia bacterium]|nr:CHAT domain-containing protein [Bacteroidia bacterium]